MGVIYLLVEINIPVNCATFKQCKTAHYTNYS